MARTLIRYKQVRRVDGSDSDESEMADGRAFIADCLVSDVVGMFVYITGPAVLGIPQVTCADISTIGKYPAVGVITEKTTVTRCFVQVLGELEVIPSDLDPGKAYFVGTNGHMTNVPPVPVISGKVAIQTIGVAIDTGKLLLNVHPAIFLRSG